MRAATRSLEEAAKNPDAAIDAMLKANPKSGVKETALIGMKTTAALTCVATAAPDGLTCLKEAAEGRSSAALSSRTSCQEFIASSRLI